VGRPGGVILAIPVLVVAGFTAVRLAPAGVRSVTARPITALGSVAIAVAGAAALLVGPILVASAQVLEDGGIVEAAVSAVGHAEEQVGADVVDRTGVPGVFGGLGQRVDVTAGGRDPIDGKVVPGEVRRAGLR